MDMEVFQVAGWQYGQYEVKDGPDAGQMKPYASIFVIQDMTGSENEHYHFCGAKAIKKKCFDAAVLENVKPGMKVNMFFDSNDRVTLVRPIPAK